MSKVTLTDLASLVNENSAINTINNNNAAVEAGFDNTLSRDGTTPNQMDADIDMNSNDLLNVGRINATNFFVSGTDITETIIESQESAAASATSAAASASAAATAETGAQTAETQAEYWAEQAEGAARTNIGTADRSTMAAIDHTQTTLVYLLEAGREGMFEWDDSDFSPFVTVDTQQGIYVPPASDTTGASGAWVRQYNRGISQYWFGAVGDGTSDDTAALQGCVDLAAYLQDFTTNTPLSGLIMQWEPGRHVITSTLTIDASLAADLGAATIYVGGATLKSGVVVGSTTSGTFVRRLKLRLPQIVNTDKPSTGWTGVSDAVGLTISNVTDSKLEIPFVFGFGTNILATAFGGGCSYNGVNLGYIYDGKINLLIQPGDAVSAFVNEFSWYDGHFSYPSGEGTRVSGTRDICLLNAAGGTTTNLPNHHVFWRPVVEDATAEFNIYIEGRDNTFVEGRYEGPSTICIYSATNEEAETNRFIGGMNLQNAVFSYAFGGTATETKYNGLIDPFRSVFESVSGGAYPNIVIGNSSSNADIRGYDGPGSQNLLTKGQTDTGWVYELAPTHLDGKIRTDAAFGIRMDFANKRYAFGNAGSVVAYLSYNSSFSGVGVSGNLGPNTDNTYALGASSFRWSQLYAGTSTINTSDARDKDWRGGLNEDELKVASALSKQIGIYRWKDAVLKKGDKARLHAGVLAQEVEAAFTAQGLNGFDYGVLCYDSWEAKPADINEEGDIIQPAVEAGERYGVRYDELWAFIAVGFETRLSKLEDKQ